MHKPTSKQNFPLENLCANHFEFLYQDQSIKGPNGQGLLTGDWEQQFQMQQCVSIGIGARNQRCCSCALSQQLFHFDIYRMLFILIQSMKYCIVCRHVLS